jgi:hypothetical protein
MASLVIGRWGLERRALVHLDLPKDYTPGDDGVRPGRPNMEEPYHRRLGVVCSERHVRESTTRPWLAAAMKKKTGATVTIGAVADSVMEEQ